MCIDVTGIPNILFCLVVINYKQQSLRLHSRGRESGPRIFTCVSLDRLINGTSVTVLGWVSPGFTTNAERLVRRVPNFLAAFIMYADRSLAA